MDFSALKHCKVVTGKDPRLDDQMFAHETPLQLDGVRRDVMILDEEVAPGFFVNERSKKILQTPQGSLTSRGEKVIDHTPAGRFGQAEDLYGCVRFLLDEDAAAFVTGVTVPVDGGFRSVSGV